MSSRKRRNVKKVTDKNTSTNGSHSWLTSNLSWLVPTIITAIISIGLGWWQLHKYVEADLTLTDVQIESDTPENRVYAINFKINNSGNIPISIFDATPFVESSDPHQNPIPFLENGKPVIFNEPEVNSNSSKSFTIQAHTPKWFINTSKEAEEVYSKDKAYPKGKQAAVNLPLRLGVIVYSNNKKYLKAISEINIIFSEGKQVSFSRNPNPIEFKEIEVKNPINFRFDEPNEYNPT